MQVYVKKWQATAAILVAALAAGCSAKLTVQNYPPFYDPALKSVAVVGFANRTLRAKASEFFTERLVESLRANGTYEVIGPKELDTRLEEAKLVLSDGADAKTIAETLRKLGGVQAFLIGTVTGFAAGSGTYVDVYDGGYGPGYGWYGPGYGWGGWGGYGWGHRGYWGYGYSGYYYPTYREYSYSQAYVAATAALIGVADGKMIHTTPAPLAARFSSSSEPPKLADEVLADASQAVAARFVHEFAVVPREIKINKGKSLRTARRKEDGELKHTGDFRAGEEEMYVVVRLPRAADRNTFRLVITRKKRDEPLIEETFIWSGDNDALEFRFSPRELAEAAGTGDYEAKFYASGDKPVLKRGFEIKDKD
jgi:hypothetical protein